MWTRAGSIAEFDYESYQSVDETSMTGSYWVYDDVETLSDDVETYAGAYHGNCYLGTQPDVCTFNFYETGPEEGISLIVAKNVSFFFESWFHAASLSQFNPSHIEDETDRYHNTHNAFLNQYDPNNAVLTVQRSPLFYNVNNPPIRHRHPHPQPPFHSHPLLHLHVC